MIQAIANQIGNMVAGGENTQMRSLRTRANVLSQVRAFITCANLHKFKSLLFNFMINRYYYFRTL